jgi:predicted amidophosphoribosyltransferase
MVPTPRCDTCYVPIQDKWATLTGQCYYCNKEPPFEGTIVSRILAATIYIPSVNGFPHNDEILGLKNSGAFAKEYAEVLAHVLDQEGLRAVSYNAIVPIPKRDNSSSGGPEPLAKALSSELGVRMVAALRWARNVESQKKLDRKQRMANVSGALAASVSMNGRRAIVIDDVSTSGATFVEAARALQAMGAADCLGLVAGRDCDLKTLQNVGAIEAYEG